MRSARLACSGMRCCAASRLQYAVDALAGVLLAGRASRMIALPSLVALG
jgi:hypothetical protein